MNTATTLLGRSCTAATARCRLLRPRIRRVAGFTIVEVMFATVVMTLAITTSITTMQRGFLALDFARKVTLAGQIMQSELEKIRLENWSEVSGALSTPATQDITGTIDKDYKSSAAITDSFTLTRTIADTANPEMKLITLTAMWKSHDGRTLSRSYITHYGKDGLYDYFYNSY